jgi:hypothetical protein
VLAFISSVTLGILIGFAPRLMVVITGAWAIIAVAVVALFVGHPDLGTWILQLVTALVGYNVSFAAALFARARRRSF